MTAVYDRDCSPLRENVSMARPLDPLREQDIAGDPVRQFARWFHEAGDSGLSMPEAMGLATATADGAPSLRMVLLKGFDERGFVFFSNYESRKGSELAANPRAALLFHWDPPGRQVRIEGPVERVSAEETAAYVRSRPRKSQLSALASPQSRTIAARESLERRVAELKSASARASCRCPRAGADIGWRPRRSSSGSSAKTASTIGSDTFARRAGTG